MPELSGATARLLIQGLKDVFCSIRSISSRCVAVPCACVLSAPDTSVPDGVHESIWLLHLPRGASLRPPSAYLNTSKCSTSYCIPVRGALCHDYATPVYLCPRPLWKQTHGVLRLHRLMVGLDTVQGLVETGGMQQGSRRFLKH